MTYVLLLIAAARYEPVKRFFHGLADIILALIRRKLALGEFRTRNGRDPPEIALQSHSVAGRVALTGGWFVPFVREPVRLSSGLGGRVGPFFGES